MNKPHLASGLTLVAVLLVGLALLSVAWQEGQPASRAARAVPPLPAWVDANARPMPELPVPPVQYVPEREHQDHAERHARQIADRFALSLAREALLGDEGAIALAASPALVADQEAQGALRVALGRAIEAAAQANDFAQGEALLGALGPDAAGHPALQQAREALAERQALAAAEPERARQITEGLATIEALLTSPDPGRFRLAFQALRTLRALDPGHSGPDRVRRALVAATQQAWSSSIVGGNAAAEQAWAELAATELNPAEKTDLQAAGRALRERLRAP